MSAMERTLAALAREAEIVFRQCHELAVQRLMESPWLYRDTVGRALGVGVKEAWAMSHAEIRERALEGCASERKRIAHYSYNRPRHLACQELAEAAKRKMERAG